jgi:hypothetical protein
VTYLPEGVFSMPDKARMQKLIDMMDCYLKQLKDDKLNGYPDDDDEDTDPTQFLEALRTLPVSEPPDTFQEDSAPQHIHGQPKRDLFK